MLESLKVIYGDEELDFILFVNNLLIIFKGGWAKMAHIRPEFIDESQALPGNYHRVHHQGVVVMCNWLLSSEMNSTRTLIRDL